MLELLTLYLQHALEALTLTATDCWTSWITDPKPYRFCYAGLVGVYLAGVFGARHHHLHALGAAFYLVLFLTQ